jgi:hypothetical protein
MGGKGKGTNSLLDRCTKSGFTTLVRINVKFADQTVGAKEPFALEEVHPVFV